MNLPSKLRSLALAVAVVTAAFGVGCNSTPKAPGTGQAKLSVSSAALNVSNIARVDVAITGGTPGPITPISATLTKAPNGTQWTGNITGIPAVAGLRFTASAYSDNNAANLIYQGSTLSDITAGATATIVIILQEQNVPPGPTNYAPVITAVSSSGSQVTPSTVVGVGFSTQDPDGNYPLTYQWSSSCTPGTDNGTFTAASGTLGTASTASGTILNSNTTWKAPVTNNTVCTLGIQVTDNNTVQGKSSVQTFFTITVINNTGSANIVAFPNSFPIISVFRGDIAYNYDATAVTPVGGVGQKGNIFATATDPDGDNIRYDFQVKCGNPIPASIAVGSDLTSQLSFATQTGNSGAPANPTWSLTDPAQSCIFAASIHDLCTAGNCGAALPVGTPGRLADGADRGGMTTGFLNFIAPAQPQKAPFIVRTSAPNVSGPSGATVLNPSTTYNFGVEATDPAGGNLTVTWTPSVGTTSAATNTGNIKSAIQYTSPASLLPTMTLTAQITSSKSGLSTTVIFNLVGSDPCVGQPDGTACGTGNLCQTGQTCTAGVCGGGTAVVCTGADQCNNATCNPNTGCGTAPKATGTICSDGNACTGTAASPDACAAPVAGVSACVGGGQVPPPVAAACFIQYTTAQCVPATGYPAPAPSPAGTACTGTNLCFQAYTCNGTGTCAGSNPVSCTAGQCTSGGTCNPSTGTCQGGTNQPGGTACNDGNACTTSDQCGGTPVAGNGVCSGTPLCTAGSTCNPVGPVCVDTAVVPQVAVSVQLSNFQGVALSTDGSAFVTGNLGGTKVFGTTTLTSAGANDIFVGKYSPAGSVLFAKNYGDANDQATTGIAVTSSEVVAVGQFSGAFNGLNNGQAYAIDYLLFLNPSTGAVTAAKQYDLGLGGNFAAIGANPTLGLVAVCGQTVIAATTLVPGAVYAGGTTDVVIAVFDSTGALQWSKQVGSANGEACTAITIDNNGNVIAAGKYDGTAPALGFTGTPLPPPGSSFRKHIWVATFNGTTGAAIAQTSFGSGAGSHQPNAIAVDSSNNYIVSGLFSSTLPFGAYTVGTPCTAAQAGCLVSAGSSDAFVTKLNPTTLAPSFATRLGGLSADEGRGVAVDSFGNITFVGLINGATTSSSLTPTTVAPAAVPALTTPSGNSAAIVVKIPGTTGIYNPATANVYGNTTNTVNANKVSINSQGTGAVKDEVAFGGEYNGTLNFGGSSSAISTTTGGNEDFLVFGKLQ